MLSGNHASLYSFAAFAHTYELYWLIHPNSYGASYSQSAEKCPPYSHTAEAHCPAAPVGAYIHTPSYMYILIHHTSILVHPIHHTSSYVPPSRPQVQARPAHVRCLVRLFATPVGGADRCKTRRWTAIDSSALWLGVGRRAVSGLCSRYAAGMQNLVKRSARNHALDTKRLEPRA